MKSESDFFKGKRPWSKIKDRVLGEYLVPYLRKVAKLRKPIVIVDAFAGPGIFEDGSEGSPLIICKTAEKHCPDNYLAIFVNKKKKFHLELQKNLHSFKDKAIPIYGDAKKLLEKLKTIVGEATLLIYLDPFGLKDCEFRLLEPYLGRDKRYSTEVIINLSMPTLHRLATPKAVKEGRITERTMKLNERLTKVLGGEYWKEIMWSDLSSENKEKEVVKMYSELLKKYLSYVGYCPVREKIGKRVKYYIMFASRHPDALILMNDIMHKAYFGIMHELEYKGTLFEGRFDWRENMKYENITEITLAKVSKSPGITRKDLWLEIIKENFMKWDFKYFNDTLKEMIKSQKIEFDSTTRRLNDNAKLYVTSSKQKFLIKETKIYYKIDSRVKIHYNEYLTFDGRRLKLVSRVNDGSIITRFDKTPFPQKSTDVICPHFLELKWAYGCPFDCAWCYLKGTFRFRPEGIKPAFKDYDKIKLHVETFLERVESPEILNTGEISDSLMGEHLDPPFSKFIIDMFEKQNTHKVLFVTKSLNIKNILNLPSAKQAIFSFSLNAIPVARRWEKRTPSPLKRIEAAKKLYDKGYTVRIRIDPMVPIENWEKHYLNLINLIFANFIPERITLGSLRGLQSTLNNTNDKSWAVYLKENSNWGKKIDFDTRYKMYFLVLEYLKNKYNYTDVALCKETVAMWEEIGMDWKKIKCNCVW